MLRRTMADMMVSGRCLRGNVHLLEIEGAIGGLDDGKPSGRKGRCDCRQGRNNVEGNLQAPHFILHSEGFWHESVTPLNDRVLSSGL